MHANDTFATITARLIADIEAGTDEWKMPWHALANAGTPTNLDGRPYRGINQIWIPLAASANGFESGLFGTYRSFQRHGFQVRRGSKGISVILWKTADTKTEDSTESPSDSKGARRLIARAFTVFAAEQADGTADLIARHTNARAADHAGRLDEADRYAAATGATIIEAGNRAFYEPAADIIHVPPRSQFDSAEMFASTRQHEILHWSGHADRLARDLTGRFGSDAYAAEELVAELGAAMWCAQSGIAAATRHDHAAYLDSWLRILRADARALVTVASKAQAAVDYLNDLAGIAADLATTDEEEDVVVA